MGMGFGGTTVDYQGHFNQVWDQLKTQVISKICTFLSKEKGEQVKLFTKKEYMQHYNSVYELSTTQVEGF